MQAAGEQQQRQHPIEKEVRQVGGSERAAKPAHDVQMQHMVAGNDQRRHDQRAQQHADGGRELDPQVVDASDQGRQSQHDGERICRFDRLVHSARGPNGFGYPSWTGPLRFA